MDILISNSSDRPIYEQISQQIKNLILTGALQDGDALPSLRFLAKELRISVITTKRTYEDLERDGFICSVAGKGTFVNAKNPDFLREEHLRQAEEHLRSAVATARLAGLERTELEELLSLVWEEN